MQPPKPHSIAIEMLIGPYADLKQSISKREETYRNLLGFVPPRIQSRMRVTGALDATVLDIQERMREHAMNPSCFDTKTAQLMLFGMLLMDMSDAALLHGIAARRAGASWEELQAVVSLCFLFRGLPAANRGAESIAEIARREFEGLRPASHLDGNDLLS